MGRHRVALHFAGYRLGDLAATLSITTRGGHHNPRVAQGRGDCDIAVAIAPPDRAKTVNPDGYRGNVNAYVEDYPCSRAVTRPCDYYL